VEQQAPDFEITVSREELKSTLARVSNFVMAPTRYVQLLAKGETALKVWACNENSDIKDEIDSAVTTGLFVSMDTWIGIDYLANVVAVMTGETITLGLSEIKSKAVIIRGDTKTDEDVLLVGSTYAISPVKPVTPSKEAKGTTPKP
jgi:DNA polymerase III sliding clamp (beta) subunit (PCNA family)